MNVKSVAFFLLIILYFNIEAQYKFSGELAVKSKYGKAYLSLVEDYRKISGIYEEQIISKVDINDGTFKFTGNNLDIGNRIYKIHVDNCINGIENGHFNGKCETSRSVIFIANNKDTINLPLSFENQSLCTIVSNDHHPKIIAKIDSLKELMVYDYVSNRSNAAKKLNNKKWFIELQQFGEQLNEPLAELYIYNYLSDRSSEFYNYYLKDLETNTYYEELQDRLNENYPNTTFAKQYELELSADKYMVKPINGTFINWKWLVPLLLVLSLLVNIFFWIKTKHKRKPSQQVLPNTLTRQEQKILSLILEHKTNKEIAQEIFVSVSTVKTHINNLYKKLEVSSRSQVRALFDK